MRRIFTFFMFVLVVSSFTIASAQDTPAATEEASTTVVTEGEQPPQVEQPPHAEPASPQPENIFGEYLSELINLRNDLELLATAVQGTVRPDGWNGNLDVTNAQLPLLIRTDMELLLADRLGFDVPAGWFGIVLGDIQYQARDLRHDIELLADALLGAGQRPDGWGGNPNALWTCSRATQTLVRLLAQGDFFTAVADPTSPDFCAILELQTVGFIEKTLFTVETEADEVYFTAGVKTALPGSVTINSDFAVGFFDITATQRAAVVPNGSTITPIGRSPVQFSRMMLVEGDGFLLYVEYPFTSTTAEEFEALGPAPTVDSFCSAKWC